jgi:serine/threonine protein kinase
MSERFASSKFGDFAIVDELYRSQAGAVYRALFKYDQKEYVLKERKLPKSRNPKDIMNEVKLLRQLDHQNVIKCEGWFRDDDRQSVFLVLEFCGGGDLSTTINRQRASKQYFEEKQIWNIFSQLCHGLRHLHEHGIIHRDLKPLNVMVSTNGRHFKLGDLGVSRQLSEETILVRSFYGTPLYLSPELVENKPYNEKTDIWSLGVILYELCCLQPPFQGSTLLDVAKMVSTGKYAPLPDRYSSHLRRCVAWMLQLDYAKRPNVSQLINFVEDKLSKQPAVAAPTALDGDNTKGQQDGTVVAAANNGRRNSNSSRASNHHQVMAADSDTADTASEGSGGEEDSLDPPERSRRQHHTQQPASHHRRGAQEGRRHSQDKAAVPAKGTRHTGTAVGSDDDTASEDERGRAAQAAVERHAQQRDDAEVAHASKQPRPRRNLLDNARLELPMRLDSLVAPETDKPSRPQQQLAAQAPRRHSIQELSAESRQRQGRRQGSEQPVLVQVDVQRVQVLLRREAATLRKLLQLRDFVAANPDAAHLHADAGADSAPSLKARMEAAHANMVALEAALRSGGAMPARDADRLVVAVSLYYVDIGI